MREHVHHCRVVSQEETILTERGVLPVLSQFHDDVSSCGEDNEGHSQHGAANTQWFDINTDKQTKHS